MKFINHNNFKKGWLQGSYTVEMALIFPIVFFVIISLIYMTFYMHDKVRIQSVADQAVIYGSELVKHEKTDKHMDIDYSCLDNRGIYFPLIGDLQKENKILQSYVTEKLKRGLIIGEVTDVHIDLSKKEVEIKIKVNMKIGILRAKEFFSGSGTNITIVGKGRVHYPAEFVRQFDVIEGIVDDIQGYDDLINKLQRQLDK